MNGTIDIVWRNLVQQTNHAQGAVLFSGSNVKRAWVTVKRRYPLFALRMDDYYGLGAV